MKTGRPTIYTAEAGKEICDVIASSSKGIKKICDTNKHFPNPDTIYRWVKEHKDFSDQYARAKRLQIEVIVDEIIDIADDVSQDALINDSGKQVVNHEHIHRWRLRIDTRKWLASKLAPKIYGDKVQLDNQHGTVGLTEEMIAELEATKKAYERPF